MQPLKETKVYIPIDVNVELPEKEGYYTVLYTAEGRDDVKKDQYFKDKFYSIHYQFYKITHWLKEQTGYFLTKQEMEELITDNLDKGFNLAKYETDNEDEKNEYITEYINKLLNNE